MKSQQAVSQINGEAATLIALLRITSTIMLIVPSSTEKRASKQRDQAILSALKGVLDKAIAETCSFEGWWNGQLRVIDDLSKRADLRAQIGSASLDDLKRITEEWGEVEKDLMTYGTKLAAAVGRAGPINGGVTAE